MRPMLIHDPPSVNVLRSMFESFETVAASRINRIRVLENIFKHFQTVPVFCITTLLRVGKPCLHIVIIEFTYYSRILYRDFTSVGKFVATCRNNRVRVYDAATRPIVHRVMSIAYSFHRQFS